MSKRVLAFLAMVGLAWLLVFVISLAVFSAWRADVRTLLQLLGVSAASVVIFGLIMAGILVALGFFSDEEKAAPAGSPPSSLGGGGAAGAGKGQTALAAQGDDKLLEFLWLSTPEEAPEPTESVTSLGTEAMPAKRSVGYIDRGEIERTVRTNLRDRKPTAIVGVGILGGIGKTELAIQAANELTGDGTFSRRLWVNCEDRVPGDLLREMLRQCDLSVPLGTDQKELVAYLKGSLEHQDWLVVLDDVRGTNVALLDELLSPSPPCAVLVTSRIEQLSARLHVLQLGPMTEAECWRLLRGELRRLVKWDAEKDSIDVLIRTCAYNPLALLVAARRITVNQPSLSWVGLFIEQINACLQNLAIPSSDPRFGLFGVFEAGYNGLSEEDQRRFRALAAFHPTGFAPEGAATVWGDEPQAAGAAIERLKNLSLLKSAEGDTRRYRLHDLLYEYAALQLLASEEDVAVRAAHAAYYAAVLGEANQLFVKGGDHTRIGLRLYDAEWPNIQAGQAWAAAHIKETRIAAEAANWYAWQASINGSRLEAADRVSWAQSGLEASEELRNRVAAAAHLSNLGSAYADLGETRKSIQFYRQALAIDRATGDRRGEGNVLANLGNAYAALGEPRKAIEFYERRLALARETRNRRAEVAALQDLGTAYAALGEPQKAIEFLEQHLASARVTGGPRSEAIDLGEIGTAYAALGEPRKAMQYYDKELAIVQEIGDRQMTGAALGRLANAYADLGETRQALQLYEKQSTIVQELGDRHAQGTVYGNLASAYADLGEIRQALQLYDKQLAIVHELGDRRSEGAALGNLGLIHAALGETRKAIRYYQQALTIDQRIGDRRAEGAVLGNLGNAYTDLGEPRKAIVFYEQHLAISREIGDRRGEGNALGNLGNAHADLGEPQEAIGFHEQHLVIAREIGDRRGEGAAYGNLGLAHAALGETREALRFYEQHLAIAREIGDRRGEGNALGNLGNAHADLGETREAIELYEQALAIDREMGDRRGEAFGSWNLGLAYEKVGELEKAIQAMQVCVDFEREIGHPDAEKDAAQAESLRRRRSRWGMPWRSRLNVWASRSKLGTFVPRRMRIR